MGEYLGFKRGKAPQISGTMDIICYLRHRDTEEHGGNLDVGCQRLPVSGFWLSEIILISISGMIG